MRCLLFFPAVLRSGQSPMSPSLLYLKPLRNSKTFLHVTYKSKKRTNLLCIKNNVFQYSKIRTRKRNATKSIKTEKKFGIQPFLESGIHWAGIRNPVLGIQNPQGGMQNPRLSWIPLHGAICRKCYTCTTISQEKIFDGKENKMVKFFKSVPFTLKRLRRREGGREEDNASSIVGMKKTLFCSGISLPCAGIH